MTEDNFHLGVKALIRNADGNVLLLQVNPEKLHSERTEYWDLPGGRVQKGQTISETLEREVAEETGVTDVQSTKEIGMVLSNIRIPMSEHDSVGLILAIYECVVPGNSVVTLSDEHTAYDWFVPQDAAKALGIKYPEHFCDLVASL
jgi:8-oxo-dGTP pyrophosphatase MutT (NUDIX family)